MKYCGHCGSPMSDDLLYCQKCGTKFIDTDAVLNRENISHNHQTDVFPDTTVDNKKTVSSANRRGMRICAIVSAVLAITSAVMAVTEDPSMVALAGFCLVFTGMFFVLSKTSKNSLYLFGSSSGIKKSLFVGLSILLAFVLFSVLSSQYESPDMEANASFYQYETDL